MSCTEKESLSKGSKQSNCNPVDGSFCIAQSVPTLLRVAIALEVTTINSYRAWLSKSKCSSILSLTVALMNECALDDAVTLRKLKKKGIKVILKPKAYHKVDNKASWKSQPWVFLLARNFPYHADPNWGRQIMKNHSPFRQQGIWRIDQPRWCCKPGGNQ